MEQQSIGCEIVTDFSRLEELAPYWRAQTEERGVPDIFQYWSWARAYWVAYSGSVSLFTPVVRRGERPIGVLPLVRRGRTLEFLGSPHSDYNDILCAEDDAPAVLECAIDALLQSPADWKTCVLDNLSAGSRIARFWRALPGRLRRLCQQSYRYPSAALLLGEDKAETLDRLLKIRDLKNHHKKLQKLGSVSFRHIESREEAMELLPLLFDQHTTRFACHGMRSQFLEPEQRAFYAALVRELDPRRELRFGVLELDGKPVAFHLGFELAGKFIHYKPTFDIDYWDYSPGDVLLSYLFQYSQESDIREFDFTVGDEHYKRRFTNCVRENCALYIDRRPLRPGSLMNRIGRRALDRVRQNPEMKAMLKKWAARVKEELTSVAQAITGPNRLERFTAGAVAVFRKAVWSSDHIYFYSRSQESGSTDICKELEPGRLSALAHLSLKCPHAIGEAHLREYRARLKKGDRVFIGRTDDSGTALFWVGERDQVAFPDFGARCVVHLGSKVLVVDGIWTSPGLRNAGTLARLLRELVIWHSGQELWVYCLDRDTRLRHAIEDAGFERRLSFTHRSLFYWGRRSSIVRLGASQQSLAAASRTLSAEVSTTPPAEGATVNCGVRLQSGRARMGAKRDED